MAVTDDDCFVDLHWLKQMADSLRKNQQAVITGSVQATGDQPVLNISKSLKPHIQNRPRLTFDSMCGGNMGVAMDIIGRVGLFDEDPRLRTSEDGEWSYRALKAGVPIIYAPNVIVQHFGWRDEQQRTVQYKDYARSHGGFYGKYLRKGDWFIALRVIVHHIRACRGWIYGVLTGDRESALCGRAYLTGLLPGIMATIRLSNR